MYQHFFGKERKNFPDAVNLPKMDFRIRSFVKSPLVMLLFLVQTISLMAQSAEFSADVTSGCFPLTVRFADGSTGSGITSWNWNFGNSNSSGLQNPVAIYSTPGVYTVSLTVFNGGIPSTNTKTSYITVHDSPNVNFSFDKTSGCRPLTVKFKDQTGTASGAILSWFWVFGDGGTTADQNPSHIFTSNGSKVVTLKVHNEHGCELTKVIDTPIEVFGPITNFLPSATSICQAPGVISFVNQTTGDAPIFYNWNFGDGVTSTNINDAHTYNVNGPFTAALKSRDVRGCEDSKSVAIMVGGAGGLDFQPSAKKVCAGEPVIFNVQSNSPVISSNWSFGNNTSLTDSNPIIQYTQAGTYSITLSALLQGNSCNSIVTKSIEVVGVNEPVFS